MPAAAPLDLVAQGLTYYDIRGLLSVAETAATEPIVQSVGLYLLSWTMIAVAVRHPLLPSCLSSLSTGLAITLAITDQRLMDVSILFAPAQMALLGTALCLVLRKPLKQLEALWGDQEQRSKLPTEPLRRQSKSQKDLEVRASAADASNASGSTLGSCSRWTGLLRAPPEQSVLTPLRRLCTAGRSPSRRRASRRCTTRQSLSGTERPLP